MTEKTHRSSQVDNPGLSAEQALRQQAEAQVQGKTLERPEPLSAEAMRQVLHELRVHQIELEMQNEELRRTQAELEASRARYFDLYNLAPVGYCTLSEHGLIVEVNLTAATLLGSARSALVNQPLSRFILPEDQDIYYRHRQQLLTAGAAQDWEMRLIRSDGTWFWVRVGATTVQEGESRVVLSDITAHKRTEEARRESEARFRQVWETTSDAMALSDAEGITLAVNPAYLRLYGYAAEQLLGQSFARIFAQDMQAWAMAQYKAVFASAEVPAAFVSLIRRADGSERIVEARATFLTAAGRRTAMLSTIRDITENKQAAERLQVLYHLSAAVNRADALEQLYATALAALVQVLHVDQAAILLVNEAGGLCFEAWHRLSAAYRQQVEGHAAWLGAEAQPQPLLLPNVVEAEPGEFRELSLAEGLQALALLPLVEQGQWLGQFLLAYQQPYPFPAAELAWAQSVAQHVAHAVQRNQAEHRLRQLNATLEERVEERTKELMHSNRELDQFAYVASHDLKAPLRAINLLADFITTDAMETLSSVSQAHLAKLRGRVKRMEKLLDDLLAYSRAGRIQHAPQRVDTRTLVAALIEELAPPVGFTFLVDEALPTLVTARVPLELVLRNLLGNAIKHHTRKDGHVSVTAQEHDAHVEFAVSDNGPGIAEQYHTRIFELFQTLKPRDQVEGSGMGLAIVKKMVESQGGTIYVESSEGHGAAFRFTWSKQGTQGH